MRRFLAVCVLGAVLTVACLAVFAGDGSEDSTKSVKRILMIAAPRNFRDEELFVPKRIFRKAGYKVVVASIRSGALKGMLGGTAQAEIALKDVDVSNYAAVVFVGGSGSTVYYDNKAARRIAWETFKQGKVLAAICLAPGVLAKAGLLRGRRATAFRSALPLLGKCGAKCSGTDLTRDGLVITANGPQAAARFARLILKTISGKQGT